MVKTLRHVEIELDKDEVCRYLVTGRIKVPTHPSRR